MNETLPCKTHPDAPHGFDRNASHSANRYVCECEGWEPVDAVNTSQESVDETAKSEHEPFIYIRADTEMPFGGYEHCGQHDSGAFPVYTAPPKKEWVGLTDEEIKGIIFADDTEFGLKTYSASDWAKIKRTENLLREKNVPQP